MKGDGALSFRFLDSLAVPGIWDPHAGLFHIG